MSYPYANGIIKAIENHLLDKSKLSKLIKLSQKDIVRALKDMGYGQGSQSDSLEDLINEEMKKTRNLFDEIAPKTSFTDLFLLQYDALNLKVIWKSILFNVPINNLLNNFGSINRDVLYDAVVNKNYEDLSAHQIKLIKNVEKHVSKLEDPRLISVTIDSLVFEHSFKHINLLTDKALVNYLKTSVDITNVLTLIRLIRLNWHEDRFKEMFIENGLIELDDFLSVFSNFNENSIKVFNKYYNEKITNLLSNFLKNDNLNELEEGLNRLLLNVAREFEYDAFGIGPFISYYLKKKTEARNIRRIYADSEIELNQLADF